MLIERGLYDGVRNPIAYGIRWAMYMAFGLMLGIIFFDIGTTEGDMQTRLNVIFYSVAFLVFMSVASLPATLENRALFRKERANGTYGALPFVLSTAIVQIPFLFVAGIIFCVIAFHMMRIAPFWELSLIMALALFVMEAIV